MSVAGVYVMSTPKGLRTAMPLVLLLTAGCVYVDVPAGASTPGVPFVVSGVAQMIEGECPAWLGDNGVTYHLFQGAGLSTADFDTLTAHEVRSRLVLATRNDLELACASGTIVEVEAILETE